jgi:hypothetical protein
LVERLSRDADASVRMAAACDLRLPVPRLIELLDDPRPAVRQRPTPRCPS